MYMYGVDPLAWWGPAALALAHPVTALAVAAAYASSVFWGYKAMRARARWRTGWLSPAHNLLMTIASGYTLAEACFALSGPAPCVLNGPCEATRVTRVLYLYYLLRVCALADTFFVVARKRDRQLTVLHVAHRAAMVFPSCSTAILHPGRDAALVCATSSLVDALVYAYYGIASLGLGLAVRPAKRWLTRTQVVHALLVAGHAAWVVGARAGYTDQVHATAPIIPIIPIIQGVHAVAGAGMLARFYTGAYMRRRQPRKKVTGGQC